MTNMQGTASQVYQTRGATYTASTSGIILNVATNDIIDLIRSGCTVLGAEVLRLVDLLSLKNTDGSALAAAASAGKFGFTITGGSAFLLIGEVATSNTKTDACIFDYRLPDTYLAGTNLTVNVKCAEIGGAATVQTLALNAYRLNEDGTESADLDVTAAQNLPTTTPGTLAYVVTGTTLNPGDIVQMKLTTVVTEAAAGAVHSVIDAIAVS